MPSKADVDVDNIVRRQLARRLKDSVRLFAEFSIDDLVEFLARARKENVGSGEYVVHEGEDGSSMFVIVAGSVDIRKAIADGSSRSLIVLGPGECFGEMAMVDRQCRSASAVALQDCVLLRLREQDLCDLPGVRALFYRSVARLLSERLRDSNTMISLLLGEGRSGDG